MSHASISGNGEGYIAFYSAQVDSLWVSPAPNSYTIGFVLKISLNDVCTVIDPATATVNFSGNKIMSEIATLTWPPTGVTDTNLATLSVDKFNPNGGNFKDPMLFQSKRLWCSLNSVNFQVVPTPVSV